MNQESDQHNKSQMGSPHGRQYRIRLEKPDGTTDYILDDDGCWFNTHAAAMGKLGRTAKIAGSKYFMEEQNVFHANEAPGDPQLTQARIPDALVFGS